MSKIRSLPYLMPSTDRITVNKWQTIGTSNTLEPLGTILPEWDPAVSIQAEVIVTVDVQGIFEDCHLNDDAVIRLATVWDSNGSGLQARSSCHDISYSDQKRDIHLSLKADGTKLSRQIELSVLLVLAKPSRISQPFAPRLVGSKLFKDAYTVQLEGDGSRFPTEVIDFSETRFPANAAWSLDWDPTELEQSVLGDMRLYINSKHERVARAVSSTSSEGFDIREAIRFDIARSLIIGALQNSQFVEDPYQYEDDSIGAAVFKMLHLFFPTSSMMDLKAESNYLQLFESKIQEKFRIFRNDTNEQ